MKKSFLDIIRSCLPAGWRQAGSRELFPPGARGVADEDAHLAQLSSRFSSELFAQLLIELPGYRQQLQDARKNRDMQRIRGIVHQLLGATAYCDVPELDSELHELRLALRSGDQAGIDRYFTRTLDGIELTLDRSGCNRY